MLERTGKTFSCPWLLNYLTKELYHWEKTHASVIILLMANIVWKILTPLIYVDFHAGETVHGQEKYCYSIFTEV